MPRTLSVEEYKELGKRYYGRRDYHKALDAFTEGIDASGGRDIQLYDYKAATYDKLDNSKAALAISRRMIQSFEKDPRGYLRAGQLLLKMDKKQQALQIYARGLKYIPATNPQVNLLRGAHDKLNRELCPPKAVDPLTQLPTEVVEMIMNYLRFYERVSCLRVSKQWKMFLESLPSLWINMDLLRAGTRRTVKPSFVKSCIRMAQGKMTYARIANFGHRGILQHLVTTCKALEKMEFVLTPLGPDSILEAAIPARQLKSLIIHADIEMPIDAVRHILKHRLGLEELRVFHLGNPTQRAFDFELPNLKVLDLRSVDVRFLFSGVFDGLLTRAPNLQELVVEQAPSGVWIAPASTLPGLESLQRLEILRLNINPPTGPLLFPSTLKTLDIEVSGSRFPLSAVLQPTTLPHLEKLRLRTIICNPLPFLDSTQTQESEDMSMLKSFTLSVQLLSTPWKIGEVLEHPRLQKVEELALEGLSAEEIDDDKVEMLVQLKHLRRLSLDSAKITGVGIKKLVIELKPSLQALTLTACDNVGTDAVDWAARQGIAVTVNDSGFRNKVVRGRVA